MGSGTSNENNENNENNDACEEPHQQSVTGDELSVLPFSSTAWLR